MEKTRKFDLTLSKRGTPCLWESGGGMTNTGSSQIIASSDGSKKKAIYIRRSGPLACGDHALIPVSVGDIIVKTYHHRGDFEIGVYRITNIVKDAESPYLEAELVYEYSNGEWNQDIPEYLKEVVKAATSKATAYHCRKPYYVVEPERLSPV